MPVIVFAAQHQLTDHGIASALFPGAGNKPGVAVLTGCVGRFQPVRVFRAIGSNVTDGVDSVHTAQVFRCHPGPDDGGNEGIAVLGNAELAIIGIQIVLDGQITGTQVFQHSGKERRIRFHGVALCHIQLVPLAVPAAQDDSGKKLLDGQTAVFLITDNERIGRRLAAGIDVIFIEPIVIEVFPGEGAQILFQGFVGKMVHIGVIVPHGLYQKGMGRDGEGVKDGGSGFAFVLAGIVPGNCLGVLNGIHHASVRVVAVIALVIPVVDHLHSDARSDHVAGTLTGGIAVAVTAAANLRSRTAALAVILRSPGTQRNPGYGQGEYQQNRQELLKFDQVLSSSFWGMKKPLDDSAPRGYVSIQLWFRFSAVMAHPFLIGGFVHHPGIDASVTAMIQ